VLNGVLSDLARPLALAFVVMACVSTPSPSATDRDSEPSVAARWVADDGSVVAVNVVLGQASDPRRLGELARAYCDEHPAARVIVTFFAARAGQERYVIGYVPTGDGPLPAEARPATALATYDFPALTARPTGGAP